jgi:hypothetical protein
MSSSSTSNSERDWKAFQLAGLAAAAVTSLLILSTLAIIDPYRVFSFSPSLDRQPLAAQRGLSVAGLARRPEYDSAVVGSSTAQIMRPTDLNGLLGGHFVNLSLWGGTAWEQKLAAQLFARHHPSARTVLLGIDSYWCTGAILARPPSHLFQEWMYRQTSPADIPRLFHMASLWDSREQLDYIRHLRKSTADPDGFENIFAQVPYSLSRARENIYGTPEPKPVPSIDEAEVEKLSKTHPYPNLVYLREILDALSPSTAKILYFVPSHIYGLNASGADTVAMFEGCKVGVREVAKRYPNTLVLDFMIDSPLTRNDQNFWDRSHIGIEAGRRVAELIASVRQVGNDNPDSTRVLFRSPAGTGNAVGN